MDTRHKIASAASLGGTRVPLLVQGYFDPLTAAEALRLAGLGDALTVAVLDPPAALLPLPARAELVAALRNVSRVIPGETVPAECVIDLTGEHLLARQALSQRIISRSA